MNKVIMIGRLTRDPELAFLPGGTAVCKINIATSRKYKGSDGQQKEDTCFVECSCFGTRADSLAKYFKKGSVISIDGRLRLEQWQAPDGQKRSKHTIMINEWEFVPGNSGGGQKPKSDGEQTTDDFGYADNFDNSDMPF